MASINARNGLLFFDFRYRGVRCREYTKLADRPGNRKRMQAVLRRIEAEIELGQFEYRRHFPDSPLADRFDRIGDVVDTPRFKVFAEQWLKEAGVDFRASHRRTVRCILDRHLLPYFGEKAVGRIMKKDVRAFRNGLLSLPGRGRETLSASTVNHILSTLNRILADAAERYEIPNPCAGIKRIRVPKSDVEPFSLEEVRRIITHVRPDFRNYYIVRFFTGMRTAEIDGLKWKYVDFERREILIRETVVQGRPETTKTDGSRREIRMTDSVYDALMDQRRAKGARSEYVFCTRTGAPLSHNNVTKRVWYPLLRHLGIDGRRPYQTRHTAATLWLAAGESPEWIARQLGHSSTEMLFRVYSRYVPNLTRHDGAAVDRLLKAHGFVGEEP